MNEAYADMDGFIEKLSKRIKPMIKELWAKCELTLAST